mmetsp:Transcript_1164/g.4164  ORF Transcript_1164/g.4164 Transcript_1164/m.4164 type:complete len:205 (-) Transcript_1164:330-944(-)
MAAALERARKGRRRPELCDTAGGCSWCSNCCGRCTCLTTVCWQVSHIHLMSWRATNWRQEQFLQDMFETGSMVTRLLLRTGDISGVTATSGIERLCLLVLGEVAALWCPCGELDTRSYFFFHLSASFLSLWHASSSCLTSSPRCSASSVFLISSVCSRWFTSWKASSASCSASSLSRRKSFSAITSEWALEEWSTSYEEPALAS